MIQGINQSINQSYQSIKYPVVIVQTLVNNSPELQQLTDIYLAGDYYKVTTMDLISLSTRPT